jgi:hypothetical protein
MQKYPIILGNIPFNTYFCFFTKQVMESGLSLRACTNLSS